MPKILVADDNANIQKMVVLAFQERGIEVVAVGNGESAVRKLNDVNPDLVLADVFMPVRNGYEVCEFIKKDSRTAHVPVILLVGAFDPLDEKEARRVGADGVLKKPFVPPDPLIAMVMAALEKNPRVAAELAKAKEVAAEPPPPPAMEMPAKKEPVPLPNFPDPTPEEAAAIYGFGKGVRGDVEEGEAKSNARKAKPSSDVDEEEFDNTTTQSSWRRAGMDLEIPEDVAGQPSFSTEQDFAPITFPSERDVPPRRIRVDELAAHAIEFVKPQAEPDHPAVSQAAETSVKESPIVFPAALPAAAPAAFAENFDVPKAAKYNPEPASKEKFSSPSASDSPAEEHDPATAIEASIAHESESVAEPEASSVGEAAAPSRQPTHWMDMMSPAQSGDYPSASWQSAFTPAEEASAQAPPANEPISKRATSEPARVEKTESRSLGEATDSERGGFSYDFASSERSGEKSEGDSVAASPLEARFQVAGKTDKGAAEQVSEEVREEVRAVLHERENQDASQTEEHPNAISQVTDRESRPQALKRVFEAESEVPTASADGVQMDASYAGSPADAGYAAVPEAHVALPEHAAGENEAESFFAPEPAAQTHADPSFEEPAEKKAKSFFETLAARSNERIPTTAPETREDLASIPFLTPLQPANGSNRSGEVDEKTVNSVVQRVLERLEPQLHELLAKGVLKPLVESLLQQELEKKGR